VPPPTPPSLCVEIAERKLIELDLELEQGHDFVVKKRMFVEQKILGDMVIATRRIIIMDLLVQTISCTLQVQFLD
jgi:hypothetical protein